MNERKFHNSLTLYHPYYRFIRYFDDLRMMQVTKKSDSKNGQTKLRSNYIGKIFQEDCYDESLTLIPEKIEDGKTRFLEGHLSFNAGFSSIPTVKNYEFRLKNETSRYFLGNLLTLSQEICIIKKEKQLVWENFILCPSTHFLSRSTWRIHLSPPPLRWKRLRKLVSKWLQNWKTKMEILGKWVRFITKRMK